MERSDAGAARRAAAVAPAPVLAVLTHCLVAALLLLLALVAHPGESHAGPAAPTTVSAAADDRAAPLGAATGCVLGALACALTAVALGRRTTARRAPAEVEPTGGALPAAPPLPAVPVPPRRPQPRLRL